MKKIYDPKSDFVCTKQSVDGQHRQWDSVLDLTMEQTRDENRFPLGRQIDADGTPYVWHVYHLGASKAA